MDKDDRRVHKRRGRIRTTGHGIRFTLIESVVVIAIIAILTAIFLCLANIQSD